MKNKYSSSDLAAAGCGTIFAVLAVMAINLFLSPAIEMWLWNGIVAPHFNLPLVPFWVAFAINWICHLLFRSGSNSNFGGKDGKK